MSLYSSNDSNENHLLLLGRWGRELERSPSESPARDELGEEARGRRFGDEVLEPKSRRKVSSEGEEREGEGGKGEEGSVELTSKASTGSSGKDSTRILLTTWLKVASPMLKRKVGERGY